MQKFDNHKGIAAPLDIINIDTDMIIPKQFLKTIKRTGLGANLFDEMRFAPDGSEKPEFVLNKEPWRHASILVAGDNFGCGSSREHAPWALLDYGIRAVISTSFADIFYNNCFKNGILPIVVSAEERDALMADARDPENPELEVDLVGQVIHRPNGASVSFEIDPFRKQCLLDGLDDIGLTMEKDSKITAFATDRQQSHPWL
ncbi:3-isopropylmalate dehydratase small subunit [Alphaproteobacteria bacterium LSUCC0684]